MQEFNLERARVYEENKIPSFKLYYSLVNKQLFYLIIFFELVLIIIANILIPAQKFNAYIVCFILYLITSLLGTIVSFKSPDVIRPGAEININKIKLMNILGVPVLLGFFTSIFTFLTIISVDFFVTKGFQKTVYLDHVRLAVNLALFFISTWLLFYVFHIYSDRELGRYIAVKKKLLSEGQSLTDILQRKDEDGEKINLKVSASNKFIYGCKVINNNLSNLSIFLRTSPTKYTLIFGVAMVFLLTVTFGCFCAGVIVHFRESRLSWEAFILGSIFFILALAAKILFHKKEWITFNRTERMIYFKRKHELSFDEVKELRWDKDYLEYFTMQIPYFRLYAVTNKEKIEIFRVSVTDEVVKEAVMQSIAKLLGCVIVIEKKVNAW